MDCLIRSAESVVHALVRSCRPLPWLGLALLGVVARAASDYATPYCFTTLAGVSSVGSQDGTGAAAQFYGPAGVAADPAGNLFVADRGNHTIRKVTPAGDVTTFAGAPGIAGGTDGTGATVRFDSPEGLAADPAGNLFVADTGNNTIRKITPGGAVSTLTGLAGAAGTDDGTGSAARFDRPRGIAVDAAGNLYVTESGNRHIRKITSAGVVTSLPGNFHFPGSDELYPVVPASYGAIAVDPAGNLFVSRYQFTDIYTHALEWQDNNYFFVGFITKLTPEGVQSDLWQTSFYRYMDGRAAGTFVAGLAFDSTGQLVTNAFPFALDRAGNKFEADGDENILRKITPEGVGTTLAGLAQSLARATVDGPAATARLTQAEGVAVDAAGNTYVADYPSHCIRKITPAGVVTTFAGQAGTSGSADGTGNAARFNHPLGLAIDRAGFLYVADSSNDTIRKISPTGDTTTLAGSAGLAGFDDGQGPAARIWNPIGVAVDAAGIVYVTCMDTVRKITPSGLTTTLAGQAAEVGYVDGAGAAARFTAPCGITVDAAGNLFVTESPDSPAIARVRKITPAGEVTTIAGDVHGSTDGVATAARFHDPIAIAVDAAGNLFVADSFNQTLRKIAPDRTVSTIAGLVDAPGSADGTGREARFYYPHGLAVDSHGLLYVTSGTTVRQGQLATMPLIVEQPRSQTAAAGVSITFSVTASALPAPTYQWYRNGSAVGGATGANLSLSALRAADAGGYTVVVSNSLGSATSNPATLTVNATSTTPPASAGGGGALGPWFVLALLALTAARLAAARLFRSCSLLLSIGLFLTGAPARAASNYTTPYVLVPLAGSSSIGSADGLGANARFYRPQGIATDTVGNVYLADTSNQTIRKITPAGQVSTLAGTPGLAGHADGVASIALFNDPSGIAVDPTGNIYVADFNGYSLRKITPAGVVSTIAASANVDHLWGLALEPAGNVIFTDWNRSTVGRITPAGAVTKIAGHEYAEGTVDGMGDAARFETPAGVAVDSAGIIYVSQWSTGTLRRIAPDGAVTTLPAMPGVTDAYATGLAVDASNNLLVAATFTSVIARVPPSGPATIVAGQLRTQGFRDGPAAEALFHGPAAVAVDPRGNLLVADGNNVVRRIATDGQVSTLAGMPLPVAVGNADGVGSGARFSETCLVALSPNGDLLESDYNNRCIRRVTTGGVVTTIVGTADEAGAADGPADTARFVGPMALTADASGDIYVIDGDSSIRKVTPAGTVSTVVRAGRFSSARGIAVDAAGNLYVSEANNIQRISPSGEVSSFAGVRTADVYAGAGSADGRAAQARFHSPGGLAIDRAGNLFVADSGNNTIRKISSEGIVTTIAGTAGVYGSDDGDGANARFSEPLGLAIDDSGNLYVADRFNSLIRKVTAGGTVSTVAGLAHADGNAGGLGSEVRLHYPQSVAVDAAGNIFVPNLSMVYRGIRASVPVIARQPQGAAVASGSNAQFSVSAAGAPAPTYQWYHNSVPVNGATDSTLTLANALASDAGSYTVAVANALGSVMSSPATLTVTAVPAPPPAEAGGGGALSAWFVLALLVLAAARRLRRAPVQSQA